jgi:signal transduction histidine kinase/DNA-binding response OmpR family regulator
MEAVSDKKDAIQEKKMASGSSKKRKIYIAGFLAVTVVCMLLVVTLFAVDIFCGVRGFVQAEGLYAKHQKEATIHLIHYGLRGDPDEFQEHKQLMDVLSKVREARLILNQSNPDIHLAAHHFQLLGLHAKDVNAMIRLYRRFRGIAEIEAAIGIWERADDEVLELALLGDKVDEAVKAGASPEKLDAIFNNIWSLHYDLNMLTTDFSVTLGIAARWAQNVVLIVVLFFSIIAVAVIIFLIFLGARMITQVEAHAIDLGHEHWLKSGQSGLGEVTAGLTDEQQLCEKIIRYLTPLVGAQVGGFYRAGEDGKYRLRASHAYVVRKTGAHEFSPGQGLVGQAALEKQPILITGIPEDYISIRSGLGEAAPRNILVFPLVYENTVRGVLEFASIEKLGENAFELLERIDEAIAVVLVSAEARQENVMLLDKAQKSELQLQELNEELQVQQEELRQSNEELEAQARNLEDSQRHLEETNAELEERGEALDQERIRVAKQNEELEKARKEMEKRARALEQASKYKSEFLANMSHELRTPLNSINVLSELLSQNKTGSLSEKQVEFATTIHDSGAQLVNLINDILDLSKIEAGKLDTIVEKMEIRDLLNSIDRQFSPMASDKGIELSVDVEPDVPKHIRTDQHRLGQVLRNLMSNAVKFTEKGSVSLIAKRPSAEQVQEANINFSPDNLVAISVTDTGIGIPDKMQQQIFDAFQQADGSTDRKYGGTGLGLAISRRLARLLGGEILLKNSPGQGCSFTVLIPEQSRTNLNETLDASSDSVEPSPISDEPIAQVKPQVFSPPSKQISKDDRDTLSEGERSLLIIEDDLTFANTLMDLGHERDYKCIIALDGESGLALSDKYLPSGILLDLSLPGMDGLAVMAQLKEDLKTRHIPIHVISGREQKLDTLKAGAVGFLQKPVNQGQLDTAFGKIEDQANRPVKRLLLAVDSEASRDQFVELLSAKDVEVTEAATGKSFLEAAQKSRFDCAVIGESLPDMAGVTILEKLRRGFENSDTPVVIVSPSTISKEDNQTLKRYADRVIRDNEATLDHLLDETALFLHRIESDLPEKQRRVLKMLHDKETILRGSKVLLVDDDMRNIFALTNLLEDRDVEILVARNGLEAVSRVTDHPKLDLVLMDIMMPEMDGYEAMRRIRKMENGRDLPIIAMTAKAMRGDRAKCIDAGANDYLAKPIDTSKLLSMMRVWLYK